jgi:hypothetical protein
MLRSLLQLLVIAFSVLCCSSCGGDQTMPPDPFEAEKAKQNNKQVKENMRVAQKAAERFAADHGSVNYPVEVDDMFKTYFPGGTEGRLAAQVGPVNPFTSMNESSPPTSCATCRVSSCRAELWNTFPWTVGALMPS